MCASVDDNTSHTLLKCEGKGWKIDLFANDIVKSKYICHGCENICKDAVELSCELNHEDDSIELYWFVHVGIIGHINSIYDSDC